MKIQNKKVDIAFNYLDPVTYVPGHVNGDASHKDCSLGVIVNTKTNGTVGVLYCKGRTVQQTKPEDLVWG